MRTDIRIEEDTDTSGVHILELCQVIDFTINDNPLSGRCM